MKSVILAAFTLMTLSCSFSEKKRVDRIPNSVGNRPPQFVLLAFDGSKSVSFWQESRQFAQETGVKFTYFVSGVYFIPSKEERLYDPPEKDPPRRSAIGFGGSVSSIQKRLKEMEGAVAEGHEVASHANGHFNGGRWSQSQWSSEFSQFDKFLIGAWSRVGLKEPDWWSEYFMFHRAGFRAPQLGVSKGLAPTLKQFGFTYDTSRSSSPNYWPEKKNGIWNFPLASIERVGTGKSTLSMDYNFYFGHWKDSNKTKGKVRVTDVDEKLHGHYEKEMYKSYLKYFKSNYLGNRAPIHIGHHFSKWNKGIYWRAMRKFAKTVCHLPEVYCGTYRDLQNFVEYEKSNLKDFQAGNFEKMSAEEAAQFMGPDLQTVSFAGERPLDHSEINEFLEFMKNHAPESIHLED